MTTVGVGVSGLQERPAPAAPVLGRRARADAVIRGSAFAGLWLSLLLVTFWWVQDRGLQDLGSWTTALVSLGRISGLIASALLLAQVLLMARLPVLERAFGQDRLARGHRLVGFTSFSLMLAHIVLVTWGYAAGSLLRSPAMLWQLVVDYPGVLLGALGAVALTMVAVTSVRAARRRLRYESWHLLHLYAYLGVGLALPHQLWTGQQFLGSTARTVFWWSAWATTAAALLVWRVGAPALVNLRHRLRVTSVVAEGPEVWSVYVTGRRMDRFRGEAGQFFGWRFLSGPGWTRAHPYSLSAAPDSHSLRITVAGVGDGSRSVSQLRPGTRVLVEGPYGRLSERARTTHGVLFLGAGVGATPLRALAESLDYAPGAAVYLERFRDAPLFAGETDVLAAERGLRVLRVGGSRRTPDSWVGTGVGVDADAVSDLDALLRWVPDVAERDVYLCGPPAWTDLVRETLRQAGVPESRVHLEIFAW